MALDQYQFMQKMTDRMSFTDADKKNLTDHVNWGKEVASEMADHFYTYLGRDAEMNAILNESEGRIHRLRETFVEWFIEMFTGIDNWGKNYADRRWKIGIIHVRVGIGPQHVVPAMATVVREVEKKLKSTGQAEELKESLSKVCMIDLAFIEQAYIEVSSSAVLRETGWTEALFRRLVVSGANNA